MSRVAVHPDMFRWAFERAGYDARDLTPRFPHLSEWGRGEKLPTFKQLEAFAKATRTPFGYLFLTEPPPERLPIPDFRTLEARHTRPSPDLLDTVYAMQRRQDWLREERIEGEADLLEAFAEEAASSLIIPCETLSLMLGEDVHRERRVDNRSAAVVGAPVQGDATRHGDSSPSRRPFYRGGMRTLAPWVGQAH